MKWLPPGQVGSPCPLFSSGDGYKGWNDGTGRNLGPLPYLQLYYLRSFTFTEHFRTLALQSARAPLWESPCRAGVGEAPGKWLVPQVGRWPKWVPWLLRHALGYKRKACSETWNRGRRKSVKLDLNGNLMFIWICSSYAWNAWCIWIFKFRTVLCENASIIPEKNMSKGNEEGKVSFITFSFSLNPFNYNSSLHL